MLNTALNFLSSESWRTWLVLTYNDKDITADISNYIESFSFTERARNGESDDLNITVENTTRIWLNEWFPERGATLTAQIITENLNQPKLVNKMSERHGFDVFLIVIMIQLSIDLTKKWIWPRIFNQNCRIHWRQCSSISQ